MTGAARAVVKDSLDWAAVNQQGVLLRIHTPNTVTGIQTALRQLKQLSDWAEAVFCMEHTGIYNAHLLNFLYKLHLPIWLESSLQIKQAGGMQRGKNDTIDAQRIAEYAYRFRDQIRLWEPPRPVIQQLAFLSAARSRLIQAYNLLAGPLVEQESFIDTSLQKQLQGGIKKSLTALRAEQKAIDHQIKELIQTDARLKELFEQIVSVPGIGATTATEIIIATNEMQSITDPKKMAASAVRLPCWSSPF